MSKHEKRAVKWCSVPNCGNESAGGYLCEDHTLAFVRWLQATIDDRTASEPRKVYDQDREEQQ